MVIQTIQQNSITVILKHFKISVQLFQVTKFKNIIIHFFPFLYVDK